MKALSPELIACAGAVIVYPGGGAAGGGVLSILSSFAGPFAVEFQELGEGGGAADGAEAGNC